MMFFSTRTGVERVRIVGQGLELPLGQSAGSGCCAPLQKQVTKGDRRVSPVTSPMPKSFLP